MELNNSSFIVRPGSANIVAKMAKLCKKHDVPVSLNSDAHICYNVGEISKVIDIAQRVGIEKEQIINYLTNSLKEFLAYHKSNNKVAESNI